MATEKTERFRVQIHNFNDKKSFIMKIIITFWYQYSIPEALKFMYIIYYTRLNTFE